MAAAIAANSARHMVTNTVLVIPALLGSAKCFAVCERAVNACSNLLFAILDITATINLRPCPPVGDFEHEGWTRLVRGEAFALFESRHVCMHYVESRMIANTAQLPIQGVLRERYFLVEAGLWIVVAKVDLCDCSKFATEMWIGSDEFGIG
eukprot:745112-Pelagomonas_calceolata.AAC.1